MVRWQRCWGFFGWVGGLHLYRKNVAFIQQHTGIYSTTHWHLYNNTQAFIQQHTGIYTTTHWHLYNNTRAFIQVMSFIHFLLNSSWHSAMNGMWTNKMCAIHGRVLPNFSFSFLNSSWHSAMNGMHNLNACHPWQSAAQFFFFLPKFFIALYHEWHAQSKCMPSMAECCPIFLFSFPNSSWHSAMNDMWTNKMCAIHGRVLAKFSFSFLNSSWHSAMNGMHNLNACHQWQSAAQFFFFLPKFFMALCHEWHVQSKCMPSMAECCPIFLFPS